MRNTFGSFLLAIGIFLSALVLGFSIKYVRDFDRFVEVKGLSEQIVKSNQASWNISFSASGNNMKQVYIDINNSQQVVINFLLKQGFKTDEIQKQAITVTDNYAVSYNNNAKSAQYTANAGVNVTSHNVDLVTNAVQATNQLVESGVLLSSNYVNYLYTSLNDIKSKMLNSALRNASVAANEFAKNSNSALGKIKTANQGIFSISSPDGSNNNDTASIMKKVRVVTTVQFFLK